jgi:hypothetical protein
VCEECGAVIDVPTDLLEDLRRHCTAIPFELYIGHFALLAVRSAYANANRSH